MSRTRKSIFVGLWKVAHSMAQRTVRNSVAVLSLEVAAFSKIARAVGPSVIPLVVVVVVVDVVSSGSSSRCS